MSNINNESYEDFVRDMLDWQIGLMGEAQHKEAREAYAKFCAPKKTTAKRPDTGLKLAELRAKAERLINGQQIGIDRRGDILDMTDAAELIADAKIIFNSRATKAQLLDLIIRNSDVSRDLNNQLVAFNANNEG